MLADSMIPLTLIELVALLGVAALVPTAAFIVIRRLGFGSNAADADTFRSIVEQQSDLIVRWKPDGTCIWANPNYCAFLGRAPQELIGRNLMKLIRSPVDRRILASLRSVSVDRPRVEKIAEYPAEADRGPLWLEWICTGCFDDEGRLTELQSVARDVSARMNALRALQSSEARFRGFVENTSDWVWETDRNGRDVYSNGHVRNILGYEPDELLNRHWTELSHPDDVSATQQIITECRRTKTGWKRLVCRLRHRDGSYRYLESTADPIFDESNEVVGFRGIDRDATFETLLARISADLVGRTAAELDRSIVNALSEIAVCYGLERASLFWLDGEIASVSHSWSTETAQLKGSPVVSRKELPSAFAKLLRGHTFIFEAIDELPENSPERMLMTARGIKASIALPLFLEKELVGYFVASMLTRERRWTEEVQSDLHLLSEKLAGAYSLSRMAQESMQRERDRIQSETLAGMGSFSYYPTEKSGEFPDGWRTHFSAEHCSLYEIRPSQASHALFMNRLHADDRDLVVEQMQALRSGASDISLQYRIVVPSGKVLHLSNRTRADRDIDGRIIRVIGYNLNVTEQVEKESSLKSAIAEIQTLRDRLEQENIQLREAVRSINAFEQIVGESPVLRACLELVSKAAPTDVPILISGETGTGKELIARAIHNLSARKDAPMVSINCSALPADLVESELFGHEKGSFTGAHQSRRGRFESADGGTVFLDEIAEMPLELQSKLLRVLQDGSYDRVGASQTKWANVRLVAATNKDLAEAVRQGKFRADLFYRLNTILVELPPLRDRGEDIPLLAHHFVTKHGPRLGRQIDYISADTLRFLQAQEWPGNIRELEHLIERALISTRGSVLSIGEVEQEPKRRDDSPDALELISTDLHSVERGHILSVLRETQWIISGERGAAAKLKLPPSTLRSKMKRLGIHREAKALQPG